ncbi:Cytochrome P450, E-class, group I [Trema orientale]|uniref:Cytochrome P450, E-class, group I n=1 Tax=Trema orientale TaxID=63057 RepID=A0A2P5DMX3_TREOI|nr:Cytochrome P450, E-class, group I [Trema orientale]
MWLLLLPLLLTLFFLMKNKLKVNKKDKPQLPPGPPKLPIIGNLHQIGLLPHQSLWQLSKRYGHVMLLQFGRVPAVVVSSAEAAKEVLKIRDLECCSRPPLAGSAKLSYNNLDVAFSPYGEHWREMRKICVIKLFSTKSVQSFQFVRDKEIDSLIDDLNDSSLSAATVDVSAKMFALTASMTLRTAFGKAFGGSELDNDRFESMIHRAQSTLGSFAASDFFPYVGWIVDWLTGLHAKFERSFHELDDFFGLVIDEHLNRIPQERKEDLVDLLLSIERGQSEFGEIQFSRDCTKAVLMDIFIAGVDTNAITITWAMAELARNPRVMKKVQDEIRNSLKKGKVSESDIHQLQYLKMVVKETLRLHPAAPLLLPRESIAHFKLADYEVHPKTLIQVNVWAIGRDPNYWRNPEEFFPERFSDSSIDYKGQNFEFLPFGAGRRGCPGIYMAMTMVELALANLLGCFDWKLPNGMKETDIDMEEVAALSTYKKSPLKLVPITYQRPSEDQT